jgi:hypothetical protein
VPRYDFVPRIGNIGKEELTRLRTIPRNSHVSFILKESLLDVDYDPRKIRQTIPSLKKVWMINSFIDRNPFLKEKCEGTLVRSEFLFLRFFGDRKYFSEKKEDYLKYLDEKIFDKLPERVIYRLCDYNNKEFSFLGESYQSRGAARLLEQEELLNLDLDVIKSLTRKGKKVGVLIPYVIFPEEYSKLRQRIKDQVGEIKVGMMLEVPANLLEINKYAEADFYVLGPSDLIKSMYGGIERDSNYFEKVNFELLFPLIGSVLRGLDNLGQSKKIFLVKNLVGHNFGTFKHLEIIDMYLPSQLIKEARR